MPYNENMGIESSTELTLRIKKDCGDVLSAA
jgi:hypothetical protein